MIKRFPGTVVVVLFLFPGVLQADSFDAVLKRYEKQIRKQEQRLESLRANLTEKQKEASRWQKKSEEAKARWAEATASAEHARFKVKESRDQEARLNALAESAQWSVVEKTQRGRATDTQVAFLASDLYKGHQALSGVSPMDLTMERERHILMSLAAQSQSLREQTRQARRQEGRLRIEEARWRIEEETQRQRLAQYHEDQQTSWLRWQQALRRRERLEEERDQLEQSAQALRVMVQDLHDHRDQTLAARQEKMTSEQVFRSLKGTLPWPVLGKVTQNFGRQYSSDLNQLLISNGIKLSAPAGRPIRSVLGGKVLFASPFQQYGELVIIQHKGSLTSVYGGLDQVRVKEGDQLAALEAIGSIGAQGSFYFELRHDEEPVNPLALLTPSSHSDLSSRRTFNEAHTP